MVCFHLYEVPRVSRFIEPERRSGSVGGRGCLMGTELQSGKMKRRLEMGCIARRMHFTLLKCTVRMVNFM